MKAIPKKNLIIFSVVFVLLICLSVVIYYLCNMTAGFDGNLYIEVDSSVSLVLNQTSQLSYKISYDKAVAYFSPSDKDIFTVSSVEYETFELTPVSAETATLTISAQFDIYTAEAEVEVTVVSDETLDNSTEETEETFASLTESLSEDLDGTVISVGENAFLSKRKISVSGEKLILEILGNNVLVYLVENDIAAKVQPYTIFSSDSDLYLFTSSDIGKTLLVIAEDENKNKCYITYLFE